ncbi:10212_t:CDS:1, partial [Gigaspora rosea]
MERLYNAFEDIEDWYWQMYDENNLSNDEYTVLGSKCNNQHNSQEVTL